MGLRNPVAPPLHVDKHPDGRANASFHLGPLYEGPPGLVHGGVSALVLDQILGEAAEAWIEKVAGAKTTVKGNIRDADGEPTVEAEGLFILPCWAREALDAGKRPPRFE